MRADDEVLITKGELLCLTMADPMSDYVWLPPGTTVYVCGKTHRGAMCDFERIFVEGRQLLVKKFLLKRACGV